MTANTSAGTKLYIGSSSVATVQADFEAESWIEVGEVENLGEFGDEAELVNFISLNDSRVRKYKGARDAGTMAVVCADDPMDEGQLAMVAAEASNLDYNFKVVGNNAVTLGGNGSIDYFRGMVSSRRKNVAGANDITRRSFNVAVNSAPIEVPPT